MEAASAANEAMMEERMKNQDTDMAKLHRCWLGILREMYQTGEPKTKIVEAMLGVAVTSAIAVDGWDETIDCMKLLVQVLENRESDSFEQLLH